MRQDEAMGSTFRTPLMASCGVGDTNMAKRPKKPTDEQTPESSQPRQQTQDDGSQDDGVSFANIENEQGTNFANINE
jgi:hypothetical protein